MKSTERMASLLLGNKGLIMTGHGVKNCPALVTMIEEQTGIEKLATATEELIKLLEWSPGLPGVVVGIANAHAAVQYYRGDTDDAN